MKFQTSNTTAPTGTGSDERGAVYEPRTDFGRELMAIRARVVASGQRLLSWEDVEREIAERRGSAIDDDR
jgi:hypothetical protein